MNDQGSSINFTPQLSIWVEGGTEISQFAAEIHEATSCKYKPFKQLIVTITVPHSDGVCRVEFCVCRVVFSCMHQLQCLQHKRWLRHPQIKNLKIIIIKRLLPTRPFAGETVTHLSHNHLRTYLHIVQILSPRFESPQHNSHFHSNSSIRWTKWTTCTQPLCHFFVHHRLQCWFWRYSHSM